MEQKDKIKMYGVGNEDKFNFYIFDKNRKIHKVLSELIEEVFDIRWMTYNERFDENDNPVEEKIDIGEHEDCHESVTNMKGKPLDTKIDVFYGKQKMFLVIHCSKKLKKKFNRKLFKITEIPEPKQENGEKEGGNND